MSKPTLQYFIDAETVTSREVAEYCGTRHAHLLRDLRRWARAEGVDIAPYRTTYRDSMNREQTEYRMPLELIARAPSAANLMADLFIHCLDYAYGPERAAHTFH